MTSMASWKVNGVVPDSDDEDFLDSQNVAGDCATVEGDGSPSNDILGDGETARKITDGQLQQESTEKRTLQESPTRYKDSSKIFDEANTTESSKPDIEKFRMFPPSSPALRPVFQIPSTPWELGLDLDDSERESTGNFPDLRLSNSLPPADEISKTYVRLTSPVSSLLSSLSGSQQDQIFKAPLEAESHSPGNQSASNGVNLVDVATSYTSQEPVNVSRRFLRERAPIQLHPYAMEQEKYRQTLKARGIAPMRLARSQDEDHRRIHVPSSDPISQDLEFQEVEQETQESQPMNFDWALESLPIKEKLESQVQTCRINDDSASNDDDEFPDIDELLRGQQLSLKKPKHRINTYSSKSRDPRLFRTQTHDRMKHTSFVPKAVDVFDIPASPPATSSPITNTARNAARTTTQAPSVSSKELTSSSLDQDNLNPMPNLPTPVTSAIKPVFDPMQLDSDSDDDPFASEAASSASFSSSDESIQIRKVSKKIRGVLPASHLRLDQQLNKLRNPVRIQRDSITASPEKSLLRRGLALPKALGATPCGLSSTNAIPPFFFESSDEESDHNQDSMDGDNGADLRSTYEQSRVGFAQVEDRIEAMLPSLKRQGSFKRGSRKKMKMGSASLPRTHQPKITEHLVEGHPKKQRRRRARHRIAFQKTKPSTIIQGLTPKPPRLSILDVVGLASLTHGKVPQFVKVAARSVRSKNGQGRQSPSRKFIRLASREDTFDAQSILEEWRGGRILPNALSASALNPSIVSRPPLGHIADNRQTRLHPPIAKANPRIQGLKMESGGLNKPRQLVVSRGKQLSIKNYATVQQAVFPQVYSNSQGPKAVLRLFQRRTTKTCPEALQSRPAQLEASEIANSDRILTAAFRMTKKDIDARFNLSKTRPIQQQNVQLHRFLADDDLVRPSIETDEHSVPESVRQRSSDMPKRPKLRKQLPKRIETGAARFRQPTEPLVLDLPTLNFQDNTRQGNKLTGLEIYGVRYPIHFDITPLQPGVFFHESTFIGSGRLSEAIKVPIALPLGALRGHSCFRLGEKDFRWGQWNEDVSSEVGLFFDCLIELLIQSPSSVSSEPCPVSLMEFFIAYIQQSISFPSSEARLSFLARMLEALRDFASSISDRQLPIGERETQCWIASIPLSMVLLLQLLQLSRAVQNVASSQLEDLLKTVGRVCVKLMVHRGLDKLRKLYDDLEYISFRERGIRDDHYIAHSWVMISRVLNVAGIPKASFWDLLTTALMEGIPKPIDDARMMERIWYSTYSLLPLCEFDDFGVVIPGLRHRASFDNWVLPQRMLRSVFTLYSSNATQSPGFNDYCRALVSRCHYLMCEWGWRKCNGIIGTLFDFFASQKLEHLRNEEVYKSPRFLMQLDIEPSLEVEPEDRVFHIFLKMVALAIRHFHMVGDERSIRNLVARLLPNHDRQYSKNENIQTRDLAALRNHHDLLCTLYWSSPTDCRPSLSLIQELVDADRSHKEACLISLRAFDNLALYVYSSAADESAVYKQFTRWELSFFDKLIYEYLNTSLEFRKQAELLAEAHKHLVTEKQLQELMDPCREATKAVIETLLSRLRERIRNAKDAEATLSTLNPELLIKILNPGIFEIFQESKQSLISDAIEALHNYMDRANLLHPFEALQPTSNTTGIDSQDSLDLADSGFERQMLIYPLHEIILPKFASLTRGILECQFYQSTEPRFMQRLVLCWARLVLFVSEEKYDLGGFIVAGANAVFENRQTCPRADKYWPLFLGQLVANRAIHSFNFTGFDLGREWMQVITSNPTLLKYEPELSKHLCSNGHYLLKNENLLLCELWPKRHLHTFQDTMRMVKIDPNYGGFADSNHLSEKEIQSHFSTTLKSIMDSMQRQLESMIPQSLAHVEYVLFCQDVISRLRGYASSIRPITDFFLQHSPNYWPKSDDPQLYAAGIVSYSVRLNSQRGKAPLELFHYLYSGWKNDQIHSRLKSHVACVLKGLKIWAFAEFMLADFVPAIIFASFNTVGGCILAETYLPTLAKRTQQFLQKGGPEGSSTFTHLINLLKMIITCTRVLVVRRLPFQHFRDDDGLPLRHRGIISIAFHFWISIQPALNEYVDTHRSEKPSLETVTSLLDDLISDVAFHLAIHDYCISSTGESVDVTTGEYVEGFVTALQDDIQKHWVVTGMGNGDLGDDSVMLNIATGARDGGSINVPLFKGVPAFSEVLELWKFTSGGITHERQLRRNERGLSFPHWMMVDHVDRFPGVFRGLF